MNKDGILAFSDSVLAQTPFGEIDITIRSVNKNDLQKLRDIIIDFYEGLATMCQNMGDECSTYGFYAEDRAESVINSDWWCDKCKHCNLTRYATICDLHGGNCEYYCNKWEDCAMYEPDDYDDGMYPF